MPIGVDVFAALHDFAEVFAVSHHALDLVSVYNKCMGHFPPGFFVKGKGLDQFPVSIIKGSSSLHVSQLYEPCPDPEMRNVEPAGDLFSDIFVQFPGMTIGMSGLCQYVFSCLATFAAYHFVRRCCRHHQAESTAVRLFLHEIDGIIPCFLFPFSVPGFLSVRGIIPG